jgi:hypothetical protein
MVRIAGRPKLKRFRKRQIFMPFFTAGIAAVASTSEPAHLEMPTDIVFQVVLFRLLFKLDFIHFEVHRRLRLKQWTRSKKALKTPV